MTNTTVRLSIRPDGFPTDETWKIASEPIPEIKEGSFLIEQEYISLDPAMRGWLRDAPSYIPPVQVGEVMRSASVGKVIQSKHPKFEVGDYISGWGGVQKYAVSTGEMTFKVDPNLAPLPTYLGALGMPGMTAYFGILQVGKIKEGDIVLVSGAAGAVGSAVGQIAKIKGCTVIGIAGGPQKKKYLTEVLGFDGAIDYKNENMFEALTKLCPKGIDVYFDNVGGKTLNIALAKIRKNARIVICGAISQYNNTVIEAPTNYLSLLVNRGTMQGMVVLDYIDQYPEGAMQMGQWIMQGKLKTKEDIYTGMENFNDTLLRLFSGDKLGKLILKI